MDIDEADHLRTRSLMILRNLYSDVRRPYEANLGNVHFETARTGTSTMSRETVFQRAQAKMISILETALEEERTFPSSPKAQSAPVLQAGAAPMADEQAQRSGPPRAFVLMPFAEDFDWLYEEIRAAGEDADVLVERADDIFAAGIIIDQVRTRIRQADIIIAVCAGRNANVFYELGMSEAFHRPILVGETSADLPFDVQHFRAQFYGGPDGVTGFRERLVRSMKETLGDRAVASPPGSAQGPNSERESARLRAGLDDLLQEIDESESDAINKLDEDLASRGVLESGMRSQGQARIRKEHRRQRDGAIRDWQRAVEGLGLPTPEPPTTSNSEPS
jgi:hypothetical protein